MALPTPFHISQVTPIIWYNYPPEAAPVTAAQPFSRPNMAEFKLASPESSFLAVTRLEQQSFLNSIQLHKTLQSPKIRRWSLISCAPRSLVDIQCGESDRGPRSLGGSIRNLHPQESCHYIKIPKKYIKPGFRYHFLRAWEYHITSTVGNYFISQ